MVADALGVPVEFKTRGWLRQNPVTDMIGYGSHHQPPYTWSDDSSMVVGTLSSLQTGYDLKDVMENFRRWYREGAFTPYGKTFGVGTGTARAIERYVLGIPALECGGFTDRDNGNGSLMRQLPFSLYHAAQWLRSQNAHENHKVHTYKDILDAVHLESQLTHAHAKSKIACGIFTILVMEIIAKRQQERAPLNSDSFHDTLLSGLQRSKEIYYALSPTFGIEFEESLPTYERLWSHTFAKREEDEIRSSGYVVDTIEAAIWSLIQTSSYRDAVLQAVNLGKDTDTVAAVAGALAGLAYGKEGVPEAWQSSLPKWGQVEVLCFACECRYFGHFTPTSAG